MNFSQFRIARPTNKFDEVISFYKDGLGLELLGGFEDHDGYDGVFLGLPNFDYHLEFTRHKDTVNCLAPTKDNLLVFYLEDKNEILSTETRLNELGYFPVEPENPYWKNNAVTFEDPEGWRIVLVDGKGLTKN